MKFHILTIFPDILDSYLQKGMLRIAQEKKIISIKPHFLRDYAVDKHGTVDDRPFGGGPGQVFMVEPIVKALEKIPGALKHEGTRTLKHKSIKALKQNKTKVILLSAKGKTWNQQLAQKYAKLDQIIFICPRYEGVDERVKKIVDEEISIGDYVLTGGELGAMVIMDSVTRLLPGVLGEPLSLSEESHSTPGYKEYPQYTRPEIFEHKKKKYRVPKVLLSGHHGKIKEWRTQQGKQI
jgi:tRNA (guanine37-N1)-methyltransferase